MIVIETTAAILATPDIRSVPLAGVGWVGVGVCVGDEVGVVSVVGAAVVSMVF
jgi:hypothetical protein